MPRMFLKKENNKASECSHSIRWSPPGVFRPNVPPHPFKTRSARTFLRTPPNASLSPEYGAIMARLDPLARRSPTGAFSGLS